MIYIEYLRRDRAVPIPLYRHHAKQDWSGDEDRIVANIGRTMKVGPEPHFMCWWHIRSIARMDEWEAYFRSDAGRLYLAESPVPLVLEFARSGLYDEVCGEGALGSGLHLAQFFDAGEEDHAAIKAHFEDRAARSPDGRLAFVAQRLGRLGPDPGGIALWTFAGYPTLETFLRRPAAPGAIRVTAEGLYRSLGEEVV